MGRRLRTAWREVAVCVLLLGTALLLDRAACGDNQNAASSDTPIIAIVHVDVLPPGTPQTVALLRQLGQHARSESGCIKFQVLQQIGRPNHFTLVEEWTNQAAYDADLGSRETRDFREKLQPLLGSPFDERLHTEIK
jgi:quinol monooxygenase YgiN